MFEMKEGVLFEECKIDPHKGAKAAKFNYSNAKHPVHKTSKKGVALSSSY